jgi:PAS domain S-box-containing protein
MQPLATLRRGLLIPLFSFIALAVLIILAAWRYQTSQHAAIDAEAASQLDAIVHLKVGQIERWRTERLRDAEMIRASVGEMPPLQRVLARHASGPDRESVQRWLADFQRIGHYAGVSLISRENAALLSIGAARAGECAEVRTALQRGGGSIQFLDFHKPAANGPVHLEIVVPLASASGKTAAAMVLAIDPEEFLFPRIQQWPIPSASGESLLVRPEENAVLFLNDLRFAKDAALKLRLPLARTSAPAVFAVLGGQGIFNGLDYRNVPVMAAVLPVPDSAWSVVAKLDRSEIDAPARAQAYQISVLAAALILAGGAIILFLWRRHRERFLRQFSALEDERRQMADAIDLSVNEIYVFDSETLRFRFLNKGALENLGYTLDEMRQMTPIDIKPEISAADFDRIIEPLKSGQKRVQVFETVHRRANGTLYPVEVHLQLTQSGAARVFLAVILNIAEKRAMQVQLEEAQKLESIGRLAGGVAHDFNNYLTVINGFTDLALAGLPPGDPGRHRLDLIRGAGEQAAALTRQLLAFSRRQIFEVQTLDLNGVLRTLEPMLRRLVREDIELTVQLDSALAPVLADPAQMGQVVMNLVLNARDAIPGGGQIMVETANAEVDAGHAARRPGLAPGGYVMLSVSDTGDGMDSEVMSHIFEPFYTTKAPGHGTGLGLAATYGIVRQTGGWIYVYSEPGRGTAFKVYLPRAVSATPEPVARALEADGLHGAETLLVVEDNSEVRALTCAILREFGYDVLPATNGAEAEEIFAQRRDAIRLLITDVVMPGLSGRELSRRLTALAPALKTIFVSGYTENVIVHQGVLDPSVNYLPKPFTPQALAAKTRQVLDGA